MHPCNVWQHAGQPNPLSCTEGHSLGGSWDPYVLPQIQSMTHPLPTAAIVLMWLYSHKLQCSYTMVNHNATANVHESLTPMHPHFLPAKEYETRYKFNHDYFIPVTRSRHPAVIFVATTVMTIVIPSQCSQLGLRCCSSCQSLPWLSCSRPRPLSRLRLRLLPRYDDEDSSSNSNSNSNSNSHINSNSNSNKVSINIKAPHSIKNHG